MFTKAPTWTQSVCLSIVKARCYVYTAEAYSAKKEKAIDAPTGWMDRKGITMTTKGPISKGYILCDPIKITVPKWKNKRDEEAVSGGRELGRVGRKGVVVAIKATERSSDATVLIAVLATQMYTQDKSA